MGVQLPSEPITRKEQYLAKAAGQAVEIPAEPITREEAYLDAIAKGSGGGGTSDYNPLSNKPQINGNTLIGNKTASQLGLVAAENGKGLSTNDFTDAYKTAIGDNTTAIGANTSAISSIKDGQTIDSFADVESALSNKQDTLTFDDTPTANSNNPVKSGGVKSAIDAAVASAYHHAGTKTCAELVAGLLVAANEGNVYNMTDSGTTTADFIEGAGQPIKAGDNVGIAKISDGVYKFDLLSGFVDTSNFVQKSVTAGLLKNDGTVNDEIEGDVSTLKSGLTNLTDDVKLNTQDLTTPSRSINLMTLPIDITKRLGSTGTVTNDNGVITLNGEFLKDETIAITCADCIVPDDAIIAYMNNVALSEANISFHNGSTSHDYFSFSIPNRIIYTSALEKVVGKTINRYDINFAANTTLDNFTFSLMMVHSGQDVSLYVPYIPSVESRIEDLESGLDTVKSGLTNVESAITPIMPSSNVTYIPFGNCVAITGSLNGNDDTSLPLGIPTNYYGVVMGRFTSTGKMSLYYVDSGYLRGWDGTTNRTFPSTDAITIHGILTFTQ